MGRPHPALQWESLVEDAANHTPGSISRESIEKVYRFALRRTSSTEDAQDVAQDIAVELVRSLPGRKSGRSFDAWMWTIANRMPRGTEVIDQLCTPGTAAARSVVSSPR
jgi:hypothetical protein